MKRTFVRSVALASLAVAAFGLSAVPAPAGVGIGLNVVIPSGEPPPPPPPPPAPPQSYYYPPSEPGQVWVDAHWHWTNGRWVWWRGYWENPPHPHAVWVGGGYVRGHDGYHYHEGHWR